MKRVATLKFQPISFRFFGSRSFEADFNPNTKAFVPNLQQATAKLQRIKSQYLKNFAVVSGILR